VAASVGHLARAVDVAGRRVGSASTRPSAAEIAANYMRGWVLFGIPQPRLAAFEWRFFSERAVITQGTAQVPKRIRPLQRRAEMEVRFGSDFTEMIEACRAGRSGWLTTEAVAAYQELYDSGFVATVGTYRANRLIGGMWGVAVGSTFGIMSMFHTENHAGSLALAALVEKVKAGDDWSVIDCGRTLLPHFESYGAYEISASEFGDLVSQGIAEMRSKAVPEGLGS
jgi:leucyl/phenylalanyl-tRNA--protein transferase